MCVPSDENEGVPNKRMTAASRETMEIYVAPGCPVCARTLRAIDVCRRLQQLVTPVVKVMGDDDADVPPSVFGTPTVVFRGAIIALGTPDCEQLVHRLLAQMRAGEDNEWGEVQ